MHRAARLPTRLAHALFPALLAGVLGTAAQLQQGQLWGGWEYGGMVLFALSLCALVATKNIAITVRLGGVVLAAAALGFGMTGLRSVVYGASALEPALEGRDLVVTGIVANLPQRNETGLRFRLKVESALLNGVPTPVPPRMDVAWYGGAFVAGPAAAVDAESAQSPPVLALNRQPPAVQAQPLAEHHQQGGQTAEDQRKWQPQTERDQDQCHCDQRDRVLQDAAQILQQCQRAVARIETRTVQAIEILGRVIERDIHRR